MPSSDIVSARAMGEISAGQARWTDWSGNPPARRLLARVLRFWEKQRRRNLMKPDGSTRSSPKRGANWRRRTVEWTSGGGEKAEGGRVKRFWASAYMRVVAESMP